MEKKTPALNKDAQIGIVGEFLDLHRGRVEPSDAALLFQFLTLVGNIAGDNIYMVAGGDKHPARLFTLIIAKTSGAKGSSWAYTRNFFSNIDPAFMVNNVTGGFSSGEGVIKSVVDRSTVEKEVKGETKEIVIEEGVVDKRRVYLEPEFSRVLTVMKKEGNILSHIVRQSWDTGHLRVSTKEKYVATGAHISIIGHITPKELSLTMDDVDFENGFGNRFLWVYTQKAMLVAHDIQLDGGKLSRLQEKMSEILKNPVMGEFTFSEESREMYTKMYETEFNKEGRFGVADSLLARAAPYVRRISVIYAFLDGRTIVQKEHLKAAYACYKYVEDSVYYLFGNSTGNQYADKIKETLEKSSDGKITQTDIQNLFNRNVYADVLDKACELLIESNFAEWKVENVSFGRPVTYLIRK